VRLIPGDSRIFRLLWEIGPDGRDLGKQRDSWWKPRPFLPEGQSHLWQENETLGLTRGERIQSAITYLKISTTGKSCLLVYIHLKFT
jgi:hypothetical protein